MFVSIACTCLFLHGPAWAQARELAWEDLLPESVRQIHQQADEIDRFLNSLTGAERDDYDNVREELDLRARIDRGFLKEADVGERNRALLADPPSRKHPKALAFWKRVEKLGAELRGERLKANAALDGARVRLPGYVLPLEFDGDKVTEFLLVPYVGACIHTPPPPANQMVYVKAAASFKSEGLFQPVWVEGVIKPEHGKHRLSLVDGTGDVDAGYAMSGSRVEAFQNK
ncbi:MAG: DUF3299 domain-containing protein [Burkholderiaceae bacterium]